MEVFFIFKFDSMAEDLRDQFPRDDSTYLRTWSVDSWKKYAALFRRIPGIKDCLIFQTWLHFIEYTSS